MQDVVQFAPLGKTLMRQMVGDFGLIPQIFQHVGVFPLLDWSRHFAALGLYTSLNKCVSCSIPAFGHGLQVLVEDPMGSVVLAGCS